MIKSLTFNFRHADAFILCTRIIGLTWLIRLALVVFAPTTIAVWLDKGNISKRSVNIQKVIKLTDFIIRFGRRYKGGCLQRALILFRLFRQAGLPVSINFGLDRQTIRSTELDGHSWVCVDGRPIGEVSSPADKYIIIHTYQTIKNQKKCIASFHSMSRPSSQSQQHKTASDTFHFNSRKSL